MKKNIWYKNRILRRVNQHDLLSKGACLMSEMDDISQNIIKTVINNEFEPVIVFWLDKDKWTSLSTKTIYSYFGGTLKYCDLDRIEKKISVQKSPGHSSSDSKKMSTFLYLEIPEISIWVPPGEDLFGLMNILLMFPLNIPSFETN